MVAVERTTYYHLGFSYGKETLARTEVFLQKCYD